MTAVVASRVVFWAECSECDYESADCGSQELANELLALHLKVCPQRAN